MKMFNKVIDLIFPKDIKCIFCNEELDGTTSNCTCADCHAKLPIITKPCPRCGVSVENVGEVCLSCRSNNFYFDTAKAVFDYKDEIINIVHKLKYENLKYLATCFANFMCETFALSYMDADVICSVPAFPKRLKERGYNQSELIAKSVSEKLNIPYLDLCKKIKDNPSQTNLDFKDRKENVKDVYVLNEQHKKSIKGKAVLIVDDVFTTGATVNEIAKILKDVGANRVDVLTFAHTPTPGSTPIS